MEVSCEATLAATPWLVEVALGTAIGFMLEDTGMYQNNDALLECGVYRSRELSDLTRIMNGLVSTLPEQEQSVVRLHYFQQIRFDIIAEQLDLSKGRISQIHNSALKRLHENYDELKLLRTDY